jgi:quinol monooxygenase YgiN
MIIIAGTITVDPAVRDACVQAAAPLQQATREQEPGCLAYVFSADPVDPAIVQVYELWQDAGTLAAHFLHKNYTDMRQVLGSFGLKGTSFSKYRIDAVAPVYGPDRVATVNF